MAKRKLGSTRKLRRDYRTQPILQSEIDIVIKLYNEGNGKTLISKKGNINIKTVAKIYKIMGLKPLPPKQIYFVSDFDREKIKLLHKQGKSQTYIITQVNLSRGVVQSVCKQEGLIFPIKKLLTDEQKTKVLELRINGLGVESISKLLGDCGVRAVRSHIINSGLDIIPPLPPKTEPLYKTCTCCGETHPINEFKKNWRTRQNSDKVFSRSAKCKTCDRLRRQISKSIRKQLLSINLSKNGSCMQFLPYTILELKQHIQTLFEPWMTWKNWTTYNVDTWKDDDQSTWTWNIDHIIPHCSFNYITMNSQEFLDCWALSNLRPYSAKQNVLDNDRGTSLQKGKKRKPIIVDIAL